MAEKIGRKEKTEWKNGKKSNEKDWLVKMTKNWLKWAKIEKQKKMDGKIMKNQTKIIETNWKNAEKYKEKN